MILIVFNVIKQHDKKDSLLIYQLIWWYLQKYAYIISDGFDDFLKPLIVWTGCANWAWIV